MQEIRISVPRDHTKPVGITVTGVKGSSCQALTAGIERALGTVQADTPTQEMHEQPLDVQHRITQGM